MNDPTFRPRLNHVAVTMAPDALDDRARAEILELYGEVFGGFLLPSMVEIQRLPGVG